MKLNIYQLAQLAVFIVFLAGFIITGYQVIFNPVATPAAKEIFGELKLFFAGLLSINALKIANSYLNGGNNHDKTIDPAGTDRAAL